MKNWKGFEREIAEIFTQAYYSDEDGEFRRIPQSGGWTIIASGKKIFPGDLIPFRFETDGVIVDMRFPFSIECKTRNKMEQFVSGLYAKESQFFGWIQQAIDDAEPFKKIPIVVFKLFRTNNIVMMTINNFYQLREIFGNIDGKYYFLKCYEKQIETQGLVFLLLKDFIDWIEWSLYKMRINTVFIKSLSEKK